MSRAGREIGHDGLTTNERRVLVLYDDGLNDPADLVRETNLRPEFVANVLKNFIVSDLAPPAAEAKVRAASKALAAACAATGSCFL